MMDSASSATMPLTVIRACPSVDDDFQPLTEYESQTPATFFDGKPVLHFHDANVKAWSPESHHAQLHFLPGDGRPSPPESGALSLVEGEPVVEDRVEVFVASHKLVLFSHRAAKGIELPYPAIKVTALQPFNHPERPDDASSKFYGVLLNIDFSIEDNDDPDEMPDPILLTLVPSSAPASQGAESSATIDPMNSERASALYNQITACSNRHSDPGQMADGDDEDAGGGPDRIFFEGDELQAVDGVPGAFCGNATGGLPPPMPGSSGWITAENVDQFFDQDGNWIGQGGEGGEEDGGLGGELGEGAGHVRGREEAGVDDVNGQLQNGDGEPKRPRTE